MPGSNPVMMETTAADDGDDYVINGQKWYTTAADGADFRDRHGRHRPRSAALPARLDDHRPHRHPGFDLVRNINVMGHTGDDYFSHAEILYHSCRVPQANLLGPEGHGFVIAQERLGPGRIHHCMRWIGVCNRAFDLMCSRAVSTTHLAQTRRSADKDIVRTWVAESHADIQAARILTLQTAWKIDRSGLESGAAGHLDDQVRGRRNHAESGRPRAPGPRRARDDRRHPARLFLPPRARGAHLRRRRRGAEAVAGETHPRGVPGRGDRRTALCTPGRGARSRRARRRYLASVDPGLDRRARSRRSSAPAPPT